MDHKTLQEHLSEQVELHKKYTNDRDRQLIEFFGKKIKEEIKKGEIQQT
ncbi:hypothetical protein [Romboutsia lituseburensis]|nr:hypothetical protein [Romboutsia lituseburensis]